MAENKKSFILYCDLIYTIEKMPNEKAGELFKHILMYVNDKNPETEDLITNLTFEPIKQQLKRDLIKFEEVKEIKSNGGRLGNLKRWNEDLYNDIINKKITLEEAELIAENRKLSHSDVKQSHSIAKIAVNDNDNDNVINKEIKSLPFSFYNSLISLGAKKELVSDWIKVRKNKKLTNTQTAFNKFVSQYNKSGYTINEVLEKCVEKSWGGFDSDWFSKVKKQNTRIPLKF
jgi:hypothetical protein